MEGEKTERPGIPAENIITIIIPVYNVKPYLRQCIDSVVEQTCYNLEIIIIDDGSTDGSGEICDEYIRDPRVQVIHQQNQGLSVARNVGLDIATGDYIMFVDSDDWVEPLFCEIPYKAAVETGADLVIFRYDRHKNGTIETLGVNEAGLKKQGTAMQLLCSGAGMAVWNKLYKKSLFKDLRFPVGKYYEDSVITPTLVHAARRVYFKNDVLYHYRYRKGSITTLKNRKVRQDFAEMSLERAELLEQLGYHSAAKKQLVAFSWSYLVSTGNKAKYSARCREYILDLDRLPDGYSWRSRAVWPLLRYSPSLFDAACILTGRRENRVLPFIQGLVKGLSRSIDWAAGKKLELRYRADMVRSPDLMKYMCPCCGLRFKAFVKGQYTDNPLYFNPIRYEHTRQDVLCPFCGSLSFCPELFDGSTMKEQVFGGNAGLLCLVKQLPMFFLILLCVGYGVFLVLFWVQLYLYS